MLWRPHAHLMQHQLPGGCPQRPLKGCSSSGKQAGHISYLTYACAGIYTCPDLPHIMPYQSASQRNLGHRWLRPASCSRALRRAAAAHRSTYSFYGRRWGPHSHPPDLWHHHQRTAHRHRHHLFCQQGRRRAGRRHSSVCRWGHLSSRYKRAAAQPACMASRLTLSTSSLHVMRTACRYANRVQPFTVRCQLQSCYLMLLAETTLQGMRLGYYTSPVPTLLSAALLARVLCDSGLHQHGQVWLQKGITYASVA